jgi:hypothetical protein
LHIDRVFPQPSRVELEPIQASPDIRISITPSSLLCQEPFNPHEI